jgi:general secretion pathway protein I
MRRAGFTLLEVLVATVIMGVAVTGLIVGLSQSVRNAGRLAAYDRAVALARSQMNDLLLSDRLPFDGMVEGRFDGNPPAGWRAVMKPFETQLNPQPGSEVLQRIALEVWWEPDHGSRRTLNVGGYRSARIPLPEAPQ